MFAVEVDAGPKFSAGMPKELFGGDYLGTGYDVAPDGERLLMFKPAMAEAPPGQAHVVMEWFEELRRRAPAGK